MTKLANYVKIVANNEECVILEVTGTPINLICLGCFNGNEKMFRLTKGANHTCTVWKDGGDNYSWYWGPNGTLMVSEQMKTQAKLIQECIEQDFEIYIGANKRNIHNTMHIKSLDDVLHAKHDIKLMYFRTEGVCCHVDGEFFKHFNSVEDGIRHFQNRGYVVSYERQETAATGCIVKHYSIRR